MRHLTEEQFIDLAEGVVAESTAPHLQGCGRCRQQLSELRTAMAVVADVQLPEPSPLFWDHLSSRVHTAVAAEGASGPRSWRDRPRAGSTDIVAWLRRRPVWIGGAAALIATVSMLMPANRPRPSVVPHAPPIATAVVADGPEDGPLVDDASFSLMAELAADFDWDAAREAGLTTHVGVDGDAVNQLTEGERRELRELLQGELAPVRRGIS
jgi:hypothetical protein